MEVAVGVAEAGDLVEVRVGVGARVGAGAQAEGHIIMISKIAKCFTDSPRSEFACGASERALAGLAPAVLAALEGRMKSRYQ